MSSFVPPTGKDKNARADEQRLCKIRETADLITDWSECIMDYYSAHMGVAVTVISCIGSGSKMFKVSVSVPGVDR
jgi:hypothetical protein